MILGFKGRERVFLDVELAHTAGGPLPVDIGGDEELVEVRPPVAPQRKAVAAR